MEALRELILGPSIEHVSLIFFLSPLSSDCRPYSVMDVKGKPSAKVPSLIAKADGSLSTDSHIRLLISLNAHVKKYFENVLFKKRLANEQQ